MRRGRARARAGAAISAPVLLLAVAVLAGAFLRLTGSNWDDGHHLHPDERYLSIVANDVAWPRSLAEYFDVDGSPLSPYSTQAGQSYLYGMLPLVATKLAATAAGSDGYGRLYLVGRRLSAVVDSLAILLVFAIGRLVLARREPRAAVRTGVLAAASYALAVTAIQHAHFFTMESWLVFFTLVTFLLAAAVARRPAAEVGRGSLVLSAATGAALGLTAACKLSGLLVALPVAVAIASRARGRVLGAAADALVVAAAAYTTFRLASPYAFERSSWLSLAPNPDFRGALERQQQALDGEFLYPPAYQWLLSDRLADPLANLVLWGLGLPLGIAVLAGLALLAGDVVRNVRAPSAVADEDRSTVVALMLLAFVVVTFAYFASRFAHPVRYLLPIVPLLCVAAERSLAALRARSRVVHAGVALGVIVSTLVYALAFVQVYRRPHTRVAASEWLARTAPAGAVIVSEHWDDALPLGADAERYRLSQLSVFDPDDDAKLEKLHRELQGADYYVLSSPRAWNTIGRLPDRFPIMARFYELLGDGRLGFDRAATFTSYPGLLGVRKSDLAAEEAFWVYDHPIVIVFRRTSSPSIAEFRAALCREPPAPPGCNAPTS